MQVKTVRHCWEPQKSYAAAYLETIREETFKEKHRELHLSISLWL